MIWHLILKPILMLLSALFGGSSDDDPDQPKLACTTFVVTVAADQPTPCDVLPGQRLDVTGTTFGECLDMGGIWLPTGTCQGVDF